MKLFLGSLSLLALATSCTIVEIDSGSHPDGLRADGLVDGYVAFGMADTHNLFEAELLDGDNPGALARVSLANLLAVEVGAVGAALTVGPVHLGLGTLFYSPYPPYVPSDYEDEDEDEDEAVEDDIIEAE